MKAEMSLFNTVKNEPRLPQAKGVPVLGVLPQLLVDPLGFLRRSHATYGDIYKLYVGPMALVVLNHPRHAQHVLRDNAQNYAKSGAVWDGLRTLIGNGLVVSEGDFWLRQRRLMQPQFHRQRLAGLTTLMVNAIAEALDSWEPAAATGAPFNLAPAFSRLTLGLIVKTLFGSALPDRELDEVTGAISYALDYVALSALTSTLPKWLPLPGKSRYQQALARFDQSIYRVIAEGRRAPQMPGPKENHLLAMLLDIVDDETGAGMDDRQLRDEVATLFLAGYETTSIALSWTFHYLTQDPAVMAKLQAEVDTVLAGRAPTFADLPHLTYARMIVEEVMRVRPPSYWLPRVAVADDEIDGYHIPAGTAVASLTYMYHHHPEFWPAPDRFDPERFAPEQAAGRHKFAWIPFGAGQRLCIGRDFSLMEAQLALAMIVQRYQLAGVPGRRANAALASTLRTKGGVWVRLARRVG